MRSIYSVLLFLLLFSACKSRGFLEQTDVFVNGQDGVSCYRIPSLIATSRGTLIAVCDARRNSCYDAPNKIDLAMKRSFDNGKTWTPIKIIANYPGNESAGDVSMTLDKQTGTIWLFFNYIIPKEGFHPEMLKGFKTAEDYHQWRTVYIKAMKSDDDGENWSEPMDLTYLKKTFWDYLISAPGNGIQSRNGRLLVASYSSRAQLTISSCQLIYSDDHGKTWNIGHSTGEYNNEPQLVELENGSLMMNMRQSKEKGYRMFALSKDGGITWSDPKDEKTQPEPGSGCQASFIRFTKKDDGSNKNRLLFANPASTKNRVNLTLRISYDEGTSWPVSKILYEGPSAYSCMTVLPDRSVGILYEKGEKTSNEKISFARFDIAWLTNGKDNIDWGN
jgi:sialidase-1